MLNKNMMLKLKLDDKSKKTKIYGKITDQRQLEPGQR